MKKIDKVLKKIIRFCSGALSWMLLAQLSWAAGRSAAPPPTPWGIQKIVIPAAISGGKVLTLQFNPAEREATVGKMRCPVSTKLSDSKAIVLNPPELPGKVVKIYYGPRYQQTQIKFVTMLGERELEHLRAWAELGIAPRVVDSGYTQDGILYAVMEQPDGASMGNLIKLREFTEQRMRAVRKLVGTMMDHGIYEPTFNPTQVHVEGNDAVLVKAYMHARQLTDPRSAGWIWLKEFYADRVNLIQKWPSIWAMRQQKKPLVATGQVIQESDKGFEVLVAKALVEALRTKRMLRILYVNQKGEVRNHIVLPTDTTFKNDDLLKGFFKAKINGASMELTFRMDGILEVEVLPNEK
ncbi:MAG: hypothetical protein HY399_04815 [Elusimicrobia bacterium]|nr:hypothetical protein [Elusimicrobiota bacterium]